MRGHADREGLKEANARSSHTIRTKLADLEYNGHDKTASWTPSHAVFRAFCSAEAIRTGWTGWVGTWTVN